jgi:hypothetical protein
MVFVKHPHGHIGQDSQQGGTVALQLTISTGVYRASLIGLKLTGFSGGSHHSMADA